MTDAGEPEFSWHKMFVAAARALDVSTRISAGLAQVASTVETWSGAQRPGSGGPQARRAAYLKIA